MALELELAAFGAEFARAVPAGRPVLYEAKIEELQAGFARNEAVRIDDPAPGCTLPEELWAAPRSNGKALPGINGDGSWELPVPASYVIGQDARIASASINVGHRNRFEPERIVSALQLLCSA